jgi:penicillin-binding protein 1C
LFQKIFRKGYIRFILFGIFVFLLFLIFNYIFPVKDKVDYSTIVLDSKDEVIHAFLTTDDKWRMKTELEEISTLLRQTILFKEDKYFYFHPGINPFAMTRAFFNNVFHLKRTSGASTITMQVARLLEPKERSYHSKLIEIFRAFQLEWKYSKDEILQLYLCLVPYGGNIEGVKSASVIYFKKSPDHLSLSEITALSIIPNRPSSLKIGVNNKKIEEERNKWLQKFKDRKLFDLSIINDALAEPLEAKRNSIPQLVPQLSLRCKKNGDTIIKTNIVTNTQLKLEKIVGDYVKNLYSQQIQNAAVLVINNKTNNIECYIGSADFYDKRDGGQVDGIKAIRQPGSALKPLLYGVSIDNGLITPLEVITDIPININGFSPENYDQKFHGYVTMQYALENSLNIPAVKILDKLGKEKLIEKLVDCNFKQIKKDRNKLGLSLILGGCGVSLEEMTELYTVFANDGVYKKPNLIRDSDISKSNVATKLILSKASNFMVTEILSKLTRPDLPVNWESSMHLPRIAWKTGTSYGKKDAWSIGYNKDYTVGVWIGNFSGAGSPDLNGAGIATPLLFKIFNTINYNSANDWFKMPQGCGVRLVCSETGKIPSEFCTNIVADYFIPMVSGTQPCDNFKNISVSANEKISYCKNCQPENGYKILSYKIIEPEMQTYFNSNLIGYTKIPPHNPACDKVFTESPPTITFPKNNTEYYIDVSAPEPLQLICETTGEVEKVFWYINNKFYKSTAAGTKEFFVPIEGKNKISCTDDKGRNTDIYITVKMVDL